MLANLIKIITSTALILGMGVSPVFAKDAVRGKAGYEHDPGFSGPSSTSALLAEDDQRKTPVMRFPGIDKALEPWFDWKAGLKEKHGVELGLAYTSLYQIAHDRPSGTNDEASSGILRLSWRWTVLQDKAGNTGQFIFSFDHRHRYNDIAPAELGSSVGHLGVTGTLFSNARDLLGDVNWQQTFNGGQTGMVAGRFDPNDFFDVLGYANTWTTFQNIHTLFNTSIALHDWSTGIGFGHWFNDQWYAKVAANDVNGVATDSSFDFDLEELYTTTEFGWSSSRQRRYHENLHITYWHADERENGVDASDGVAIGANWTFDDTWMPFSRAGWSDGSAPLYKETYTIGMLRYFASRSDLMGLAINWGDPVDDSLREQITSEFFYRIQLAENFAITPSLQYLYNPALDPNENDIWIIGLRARITL